MKDVVKPADPKLQRDIAILIIKYNIINWHRISSGLHLNYAAKYKQKRGMPSYIHIVVVVVPQEW